MILIPKDAANAQAPSCHNDQAFSSNAPIISSIFSIFLTIIIILIKKGLTPHPKVNVFFSKRSYNNWLWSPHSSLWKSIFTLKTRQCNQALFDFFWGIIKCESNSSQDAPIKTGRFSSFLPIIKLDFDPRKCHKVDFFLKTYLEKRAFFRLFW